MSTSTKLVAKINKYLEQPKSEKKMKHALSRLDKIAMTIDLLKETGVGKVFTGLCHHEIHGEEVSRIHGKWQEMARASLAAEKESDEKPQSRKRAASPAPAPKKSLKIDTLAAIQSIVVSPTSSISSPSSSTPSPPKESKENIDPEMMFKAKAVRLKVYAGRRKPVTLTEVPTLTKMCQKVVVNNINSVKVPEQTTFDALRPVLEKFSFQQLADFESRNPRIVKNTDGLWEKFFKKSFFGKRPFPGETYKKAFFRLNTGNEDRLKAITEKIKNSMRSGEIVGQKKTTIAVAIPTVRPGQKKLKPIDVKPKTIRSSSNASIVIPIPMRASGVSKKPEVKKGPLMAKTLKMCNSRRH